MNDEVLGALELDMAEKATPTHSPPVPAWRSFMSGCISGMAAVVVGQPFDTVKIRLQTSPSSLGATSCVKQIIAGEGPLALFKGMVSPLLTASLVNAIAFSSYNETLKALMGTEQKERRPTYSEVFVGGAIAGVVQCSVHTPAEVVKCRLQMQSSNRTYQGPLDCLRSIVAKRGAIGLYQGLGSNIVRDLPAFGTYFALYEVMKDALAPSKWPLWASSFTAGAVAGAASWVVCYPADVIKSMIQIEPSTAPAERRSLWPVARRLYAQYGHRVFFNGMGVTILRALPVNGVVFPMYEVTLSMLEPLDHMRQLPVL